MKTTDKLVSVTQILNKSNQEVWKAITEHDQMIQRFFENLPDFKPEVGFKTQFNVKASGRDFMHLWEVTEVNPNKNITINWKYGGF